MLGHNLILNHVIGLYQLKKRSIKIPKALTLFCLGDFIYLFVTILQIMYLYIYLVINFNINNKYCGTRYSYIALSIIERKYIMKAKFEQVYNELKNTIYNYLYYMVKDEQLSQDLSQETFLKIYLNLSKFRGDSSIKTWSLVIARNVFLNYIRKKNPSLVEEKYMDLSITNNDNMPEDIVIKKENSEIIKRVLFSLKEEDRTVLILRDHENLSYSEIGQIMKISEVVVKSRIFRARGKYKEQYLKLSNSVEVI